MQPRKPPIKEGFFCIGVISGVHGIKGELVIKPFTEAPENINKYGVPVDFTGAPFVFSSLRVSAKGLVVTLENINDRNQAEALRGTFLYAPIENLPEIGDDNVYLYELKNMLVMRENCTEFGKVIDVMETGAGTVFEVLIAENNSDSGDNAGKKVLLPFNDDIIVKVERATKIITVNSMADEFLTL